MQITYLHKQNVIWETVGHIKFNVFG